MDVPSQKVLDDLNSTAMSRTNLDVRLEAENKRFKKLEAEHLKRVDRLHAAIQKENDRLWRIITRHGAELMKPGKQSFTTMHVVFQKRRVTKRPKLIDSKGALDVARELRVVRKIGRIKVSWSIDAKMFWAWLDTHSEYRERFADFIEEGGTEETLTIKPNGNFAVQHDGERISPPPIRIEKSSSPRG